MSATFFPVNDLLRRRLQTAMTITGLALPVASTIFLLTFAQRIGMGISLSIEGKLTAGFGSIYAPFVAFLLVLIIAAGIVTVSFMAHMMMSQRIRDIGLMKAAGCPNDLMFGYFVTELLLVTLGGCIFGVFLGILTDFVAMNFMTFYGLQVSQEPINLLLTVIVSALYFALSMSVGVKPILDASRIGPAKAMSPTHHLGLTKGRGFTIMSRSGLTLKMAVRNLSRHKNATFKIVLCLSMVFVLVTIGVAGGMIADQTTKSWIEQAVGRNMLILGHKDMTAQYVLLLAKFHQSTVDSGFNYMDRRYQIPEEMFEQLQAFPATEDFEARLILKTSVEEIQGIIIGNATQETRTVGDDREGESLIVGVEPSKVLGTWFLDGRFLNGSETSEAVIGDTLARNMFSQPLVQKIKIFDRSFAVVGVCLDPVDNGRITYVPLRMLQDVSNGTKPNLVMVRIGSDADREQALNQLNAIVGAYSSEFDVVSLDEVLNNMLGFVGYVWSSVMLIPFFSLASAFLCVLGYVMLAIAEQHQEFGILRALGAKPRNVVSIVSLQNVIVLLASYALGVAFGTMITLLILIPMPIITTFAVLQIAGFLMTALAAVFVVALYPAVRFARKPILQIINQP